MNELNLVVIADRNCSTSRTYLTYLFHAGYRVQRLLVVDFLFGKKEIEPTGSKIWNAASALFGSRFRPSIPNPELPISDSKFIEFCHRLMPNMPLEIDYTTPFDFEQCATDIEVLTVDDYNDQRLQDKISAIAPAVFLYTNGGMVPQNLLDRSGVEFLHIHPGVVPAVRGSDGLYWSLLARGRPGASCFYMSPGIDTGDVIQTMEFENPSLSGFELDEVLAFEDQFYRAVLYALDPHLRAQLLLDVVERAPGGDLAALSHTSQSNNGVLSYYWMHPRLRRRVNAAMIKRGLSNPAGRVVPISR